MGLNIISDKFKAVSTILTAVCAICSISWIIFKEIHTYNTQKEDVKFTKEQVMSFKNDMDSLRNENEKLKAEIFSLKIHLEPVFDFMNNQLYDYMHNNIRFKQTSDGKLFFIIIMDIITISFMMM